MKKNGIKYLSRISASIFLLFIVLKQFHVGVFTDCSWWWIVSPFWIPLAFVIGVFAFCVVVVGTLDFFLKLFYGKRGVPNKINKTK